MRELTRLVELAAKVTGELAGQQVNVQTNMISAPQILSITDTVVLRRLLRTIRSMYGLESQDWKTSWVIITENQLEEMTEKFRQVYGVPISTDRAIILANDTSVLEEANADEA